MKSRSLNKNSKYAKFWREARIKKGLSQGGLARVLGLSSPQYISNVERGICQYSHKYLSTLIKELGVTTETVMKLVLEDTEDRVRQTFKKSCGSE